MTVTGKQRAEGQQRERAPESGAHDSAIDHMDAQALSLLVNFFKLLDKWDREARRQ